MDSLLASFEARRQQRLPANARIQLSARDFLILDWLVSPPLLQRMIVIYDADRDDRILDVLSALNYRSPQIRANLLAIAESKGRIDWWYGDPATVEFARRPLQEAADAAIGPFDHWTTNPPNLVPMLDGVLDRDNLPARDLRRQIAPARFDLGLVRVQS